MADRTLRAPARTAALWLAGALLAAGLALLLAGGGPQPAPPGLPDAGLAVGWLLRAVHLLGLAAGIALVGLALVPLLADRPVPRRAGVLLAAGWASLLLTEVVLQVAETTGTSPAGALRPDVLRFYVTRVDAGRALVVAAVLATAAAVAVASGRAATRSGAAGLLVGALTGLVPQQLAGHAATADHHRLAQTALVVHVLGAALWLGGLGSLLLQRVDAAATVPRFSRLALGCAGAVLASGVLSAALVLDELSALWTTGYGGLVLAKSAALGLLLAAGAAHRRRSLPALLAGSSSAFHRLAVAEVALMAAVLGLASALTRTPAP